MALRRAALLALVAAACGGGDPDVPAPPASDALSAADPQAALSPADSARVEAATRVIAFLRGEADFSGFEVADTVWFHLAPEGGGDRTPVPRERLRERGSWRVVSARGEVYPLVPPRSADVLSTRVGQHFNCVEYPLRTRAPELAALPHVGTRLQPVGAPSCLAAWNLTLVFAAGTTPATLVAAVYDQWEW